MAETEKITINMSVVDLGKVDQRPIGQIGSFLAHEAGVGHERQTAVVLDNGRHPANSRCAGTCYKIFSFGEAGILHVDMGIDTSGQNVQTRGINDLRPLSRAR